jgi:hypothetical protein
MENPILKIDWTDLRTQKGTLLILIAEMEKQGKDVTDLDGILNLIDALQDYAVDELGVPEMHVFDFELEEERENETPAEKFARESAQRIFDELCESDGFHQDDEMPSEFIESIMADHWHADIIRAKIKNQILNDLKAHPVLFDITETTKELQYDGDMREDYEGVATQYIRELFNNGKTKTIWLCPHCGSDNVEMKNWVNANTGEVGTDCEEDEGYCQDCEQRGELILSTVKETANVVGYQVVGEEGHENEGELHSLMAGSFCLYSLSQAKAMLDDDNTLYKGEWKLLAIWTGDVEEPTIMFEGDPRK